MPTNEITYYKEEVNGYYFRMVSLPGGIFEMGDPENLSVIQATPVHQVEISPFYIGEFLVTQALWKEVMGNDNPSYFKGNQRPVEQVSWIDIVVGNKNEPSFLQKLNELTISTRLKDMIYRLPTESEWEYAARANVSYSYSGSDQIKRVGWFIENSHSETKTVGLKQPNDFGLYDMSANVYEWCEDSCFFFPENDKNIFYQECYKEGIVKNPVSRNGGSRIVRGGSWSRASNRCSVSRRSYDDPTFRDSRLGFRLVLAPSLER